MTGRLCRMVIAALAAAALTGCDVPDTRPPHIKAGRMPPIPRNAKVVTLPSGLRYVDQSTGWSDPVSQPGYSNEAKPGYTVEVHFICWLANGRYVDSSMEHGLLEYRLGTNKPNAGLDEGVTGMKLAGRRQLIVPHRLAYGERGLPGKVPPKSDLVYVVTLMSARTGE